MPLCTQVSIQICQRTTLRSESVTSLKKEWGHRLERQNIEQYTFSCMYAYTSMHIKWSIKKHVWKHARIRKQHYNLYYHLENQRVTSDSWLTIRCDLLHPGLWYIVIAGNCMAAYDTLQPPSSDMTTHEHMHNYEKDKLKYIWYTVCNMRVTKVRRKMRCLGI